MQKTQLTGSGFRNEVYYPATIIMIKIILIVLILSWVYKAIMVI